MLEQATVTLKKQKMDWTLLSTRPHDTKWKKTQKRTISKLYKVEGVMRLACELDLKTHHGYRSDIDL